MNTVETKYDFKTDSNINLVDEAFTRVLKIRQLKRQVYESFEKMGAELYVIYQDYEANAQVSCELYGFESFNALLEAPEDSAGLDFSKQTAYQILRVFEKYAINLGVRHVLQNIDYVKLDIIRKVINEGNKEEWFHKAQCLARSDLRREVNEALGKQVIEYEDKIKQIICPKCGYYF